MSLCGDFLSLEFIFFEKVLFYVSGLVKYNPIAASHMQGPGNQSICLLRENILATTSVMKAYAENIAKYSEVKRQTDPGDRTEQYASKEECIKWNK